MANITTTIHFNSATDLGGALPWVNPANTAVSDGVYGTVAISPSSFANDLNPIAAASEFAAIAGRVPISLTFKMRIYTDDASLRQTIQAAGEESWFSPVSIESAIPGHVQTFPTFTPFNGTKAQKIALLNDWATNGFQDNTAITIRNNAGGVAATISIDWITFDLVTGSASTRNRRRQLAARRGAACNRS